MSTSYNIAIIYGFKADSPVKRDRKTGKATYLAEWLEENYPKLQQHNAGCSNGGSPDYFVGIKLHEVEDFTRSYAWTEIPDNLNSGEFKNRPMTDLYEARAALALLEVIPADRHIGFYLTGDAA